MWMPNQLMMYKMVPKVVYLQILIKTKLFKPGIDPEVADLAKQVDADDHIEEAD